MTGVRSFTRGRSELGVAALLGALAVTVFADTMTLRGTSLNVGVLGPRVVPFLIAAGLGICAVLLAVDVLRGGHGEPEQGEDIDPERRTDWKALLGLGGLILVAALAIPVLGWPIAAALQFYGSSLLLGSRHWIRAAIVAVVLSLATFYAFVVGLGINLPAGLLNGIL